MKRAAAFLAACLACALVAAGQATAAVERKVLRMAFRTAETGFDPQRIFDRYSVGILVSAKEAVQVTMAALYDERPNSVLWLGAGPAKEDGDAERQRASANADREERFFVVNAENLKSALRQPLRDFCRQLLAGKRVLDLR